jgi:hypothetical protein
LSGVSRSRKVTTGALAAAFHRALRSGVAIPGRNRAISAPFATVRGSRERGCRTLPTSVDLDDPVGAVARSLAPQRSTLDRPKARKNAWEGRRFPEFQSISGRLV